MSEDLTISEDESEDESEYEPVKENKDDNLL